MIAYRAWTSLVGVLCLTGTAVAQSNYFGASDPYGVRMTRLDDSTSVRTPMLHSATPATNPATGNSAPETVATPQPAKGGVYSDALNNSGWGENNGGGCGGGCESCMSGCCAQNNWYAYVGGLVMGRDMPNKFWTTFNENNAADQLRYFPGADWGGGVDTRIGYWFGCGCGDPCNQCCGGGGRFGIEAVYWGTWGLDGHSSINDPTNSLGTVQDDGLVSFGANPASYFFDNARAVELSRNDEIHNVEINFMYLPVYTGSRLQITGFDGRAVLPV